MSKYKLLPGAQIIDRLVKKIASIRTGSVNSSILENVFVEAYGSKMHFEELATITKPEPTQLMITPFDKSVLNSMYKAILDSNLGINPVNDGAGLRLNFPPLTEETRRIKVKEINQLAETAKIELRQTRQDLIKTKRKEETDGFISESELTIFESSMQKEVDELNKEIEAVVKAKEVELMKI
jgi:ribosome recycling factor